MRSQLPCIFAAAIAITGVTLPAQVHSGDVFGRVVDSAGAGVASAEAHLSGIGASRVATANRHGEFRLLTLAPGRYTLTVRSDGFGTVVRAVDVSVGTSRVITITMVPAVNETVTVSAETPLLDVRKMGTGAALTRRELDNIPSARDPWSLLRSVPGVLVGRLDVGGSETGQQIFSESKGAAFQTSWNLDGIEVTDMVEIGASLMHYDFDSFEEIGVTTSGADARLRTAGTSINLVTRRGTNDFRGSARRFDVGDGFQEKARIPSEAAGYLASVNEIDSIHEYGLESGGAFRRDRLWFWFGASRRRVRTIAAQNTTNAATAPALEKTTLENLTAKLNFQLSANNTATLFYNWHDRVKFGEESGPLRPAETTLDQVGPGDLWKLEVTHVFSPAFHVSATYSDVHALVDREAAGGRDAEAWTDELGVWHDTYKFYRSLRPQKYLRFDSARFLGDSVAHEVRLGFGYRRAEARESNGWPGGGNHGVFFSDGSAWAYLTRPGNANYRGNYSDLYLSDTLLWDRLTVQMGVRYDEQRSRNLPGATAANPLVPELLPAATFPGDHRDRVWKVISPRLGFTYQIGHDRRTLVRAAYNRYAGQLPAWSSTAGNSLFREQSLIYNWEDRNHDNRIQKDEVRFDLGLVGFIAVDPADPSSTRTTARIDYESDPRWFDEVICGIEREFAPALNLSATYTYRRSGDFSFAHFEKTPGAGDFYTSDDYVLGGMLNGNLPDGRPYSVPYYRLKPGIPAPTHSVHTDRAEYEQAYHGVELVATMRMRDRLAIRANLALHNLAHQVGNHAVTDPTEAITMTGCQTCDGGIVATSAPTATGAVNSRWTYNATAVYELGAGFVAGANLHGREGSPIAYHHRIAPGDGTGQKLVLAADLGDYRLDDVVNADIGISKRFRIRGRFGLTLSTEIFNVTNERTVLQREERLYNSTTSRTTPNPAANRVLEVQSPRVLRVGARVVF